MSRPPLVCADRSGFLFAHACDRPAAGACSVCGKAICMQHTRMQASGPTCVSCLREDENAEAEERADDPYFFPGADRESHYDADDEAAFEPPGPADAEEEMEENAGAETDTGAS